VSTKVEQAPVNPLRGLPPVNADVRLLKNQRLCNSSGFN
jgi:hypothetical protein